MIDMKIVKTANLVLLVLLLATGVFAAELPKWVDVGADKCIPCIQMVPMLDDLKEDFAGRLDVEFVDAWKN